MMQLGFHDAFLLLPTPFQPLSPTPSFSPSFKFFFNLLLNLFFTVFFLLSHILLLAIFPSSHLFIFTYLSLLYHYIETPESNFKFTTVYFHMLHRGSFTALYFYFQLFQCFAGRSSHLNCFVLANVNWELCMVMEVVTHGDGDGFCAGRC